MNKKDHQKIVLHAAHLIRLYNNYHNSANSCWDFYQHKQTLYDSLNSLKHFGLIEDYSFIPPFVVTNDGITTKIEVKS